MVDAGDALAERHGLYAQPRADGDGQFFDQASAHRLALGRGVFRQKLLDYELSSNNGGWQWAAGSGTDAAPYFRIFNPESQLKKFDPQKQYVKRWVPEFGTDDYPEPIVRAQMARERCLERYKAAM